MKNFCLSLCLLFLIFPLKISALEYIPRTSGHTTIYSKPESSPIYPYYTDLYIDISNIENIYSLEMIIRYDRNLVGLSNCHLLNYAGSGCQMGGGWEYIYYSYKASDPYSSLFNNYAFYTVTFMPMDTTPLSGSTEVSIEFKNVKDKEQNTVSINPIKVSYSFADAKDKFSIRLDEEEKTEENVEEETNEYVNPVLNDNKDNIDNEKETNAEQLKTSSNNYLNKLDIAGYDIKFSKETGEYYIALKDNIDSLDITAEAEDQNAVVTIEDNKNLTSKDNSIVLIKVVAENGDKREYLVHTKLEKGIVNSSIDSSNMIDNLIVIFAIGFIILVCIVVFLVLKHKENKMFSEWKDL